MGKPQDWYYIQLIPVGVKKTTTVSYYLGTIYGYTHSYWLAARYLDSLQQFIAKENDSFFSETSCEILTIHFRGTLSSFYDKMRTEYGKIITGEDIIEVFVNDDNGTYSLSPSMSVISTCGDILGGKFINVINNYLLDRDCSKLYQTLLAIGKCLDVGIFRQYQEIIGDVISVLYQHPLMERYCIGVSEAPDYFDSSTLIERHINIVTYGILKGRYLPL